MRRSPLEAWLLEDGLDPSTAGARSSRLDSFLAASKPCWHEGGSGVGPRSQAGAGKVVRGQAMGAGRGAAVLGPWLD